MAAERLTSSVRLGLGTYLHWVRVLADSEARLAADRTQHSERADALATQRLTGSVRELATLGHAERLAHEQRLGHVELDEAIREAQVYMAAFQQAADTLAQAGARTAAALKRELVAARLAELREQLARTREAATAPDAELAEVLAAFGTHRGRPVPPPTLVFPAGPDVFTPPAVAEG